jgi:hypothetical protein
MGSEGSPQHATPGAEGKKRKRVPDRTSGTSSGKVNSPTHVETDLLSTPANKKGKKSTAASVEKEKRLRRFRQKAPQTYLEKLHRATTQR